jgi:hypothetical protein
MAFLDRREAFRKVTAMEVPTQSASGRRQRALAMALVVAGLLGIAAGFATAAVKVDSAPLFGSFWLLLGAGAFVAVISISRLEVFRSGRASFTPMFIRSVSTMLPVMLVGLFFGWFVSRGPFNAPAMIVLSGLWMMLLGCGWLANAPFLPGGVAWLGWMLLVLGGGAAALGHAGPVDTSWRTANLVMGLGFGVPHLLAGLFVRMAATKEEARAKDFSPKAD